MFRNNIRFRRTRIPVSVYTIVFLKYPLVPEKCLYNTRLSQILYNIIFPISQLKILVRLENLKNLYSKSIYINLTQGLDENFDKLGEAI